MTLHDLFYRHECFTGKYVTCKLHTKPHPGLGWHQAPGGIFSISSLVKILMISLISSLSVKLYLNLLVDDRNMFGSSSKIFGNFGYLLKCLVIFRNFRKMFGNVLVAFGQLIENLRKSSESGRKSSENRQKRRYQYVYII